MVNKLGKYKIHCSQPVSHVEVKGMIGTIEIFNTEEEIKDLINEQNGVKVEKVIRINRGREKTPTTTIKLVYHTDSLPEIVKINWENFKIRPFVETPLQCFRCQFYGHSAKTCCGREKCVMCAVNHRLI